MACCALAGGGARCCWCCRSFAGRRDAVSAAIRAGWPSGLQTPQADGDGGGPRGTRAFGRSEGRPGASVVVREASGTLTTLHGASRARPASKLSSTPPGSIRPLPSLDALHTPASPPYDTPPSAAATGPVLADFPSRRSQPCHASARHCPRSYLPRPPLIHPALVPRASPSESARRLRRPQPYRSPGPCASLSCELHALLSCWPGLRPPAARRPSWSRPALTPTRPAWTTWTSSTTARAAARYAFPAQLGSWNVANVLPDLGRRQGL